MNKYFKFMKLHAFKLAAIAAIVILVSFIVFGSSRQSDEDRRELLMRVVNFAIENGHYDPGDLDDSFSEKAFDNYLDILDFGKRFLIEEDVLELARYRHELDDAMLGPDFDFFDLSIDILDRRIKESQEIYRDILSKPFDFARKESWEADSDKREFAANKEQLREYWRKSLKYEAMTRIYDRQKTQKEQAEQGKNDTLSTFAELEAESREKLMERYDDWYHRMEKLDEDDRLGYYVNALVSVLDPHTEYFPPREKENFDIRFSGQLEGIGAQLTQKNAYVEVTRIIPGSPSWKQGDLEVGDYILKVAQEGEEPVDIVDMRLDDAVQLIRGKKGTRVTLTTKKMDGTIMDITLVRDVVVMEETYAKSAIIRDDAGDKEYGYIKLPSFYVDFTQINGRNCFDDMKSEIRKLKDDGIDGLVFDLRDNGGGSLEDVVSIAGLFIEQGPIVQARSKRGQKRVLADTDPAVQYDGPLVVMVNTISASASEIFAAAMQDYNRAIIVGSDHTYGKGTVQNFTELDRLVPRAPAGTEELGSLKMTVQKFYRINGDATQRKGVTPDIVFPDYYNYMDFGEKELDYAMPWDEIASLEWSPWTLTFDKDYILDISNSRIRKNEMLSLVDENGRRMRDIREQTDLALNYDDYTEMMKKREEKGEKYKQIGKETFDINVTVTSADLPAIEADTSRKARSDAWVKDLKKDVYLVEAYNVLKDISDYQVKQALRKDD